MKRYTSDGIRLTGVEYDDSPGVGDLIDGMCVISVNERSDGYALFLQDNDGSVGVLVLDENYIVGRVFGFENLPQAVEAWVEGEI